MVRPGLFSHGNCFSIFFQKPELAPKKNKTAGRPTQLGAQAAIFFLAGRAVGFFREISFPFFQKQF